MLLYFKICKQFKFSDELREVCNRATLDCSSPRLASWTGFNARRLRRFLHANRPVGIPPAASSSFSVSGNEFRRCERKRATRQEQGLLV